MADQSLSDFQQKEYELYLDERKQLIDAARESSRTFDKAVLTFGAAVFGASIAFLKDIAPIPAAETMKWLGASWLLFSLGLLAILLSFVFSHRACMFEIDVGQKALGSCDFKRKRNLWSVATISCNFLCIALLFIGLLCWSRFALKTLAIKRFQWINSRFLQRRGGMFLLHRRQRHRRSSKRPRQQLNPLPKSEEEE
jgi:hypothetical protein